MEPIIREVSQDHFAAVEYFYASLYKMVAINDMERVLVANHNSVIVGAVRLCSEEEYVVLRTMQIYPAYQRLRIGTRMLYLMAEIIQDQNCYCLAHSHLANFYAQIGFAKIMERELPAVLQRRMELHNSTKPTKLIALQRSTGKRAPIIHYTVSDA